MWSYLYTKVAYHGDTREIKIINFLTPEKIEALK
jgi:hypothetical protein